MYALHAAPAGSTRGSFPRPWPSPAHLPTLPQTGALMDDSSGCPEAKSGAANGDGAASGLAAQAVRFAVADRSILNGIDLTVAPGEKLAVIGPNGSGKSTLLRCLYAWHRPTGGAILLDGTELANLPSTDRAQRIAVLAQHSEPGLGLSVAEVVALGRLPHRKIWSGETLRDAAVVARTLHVMGLTALACQPLATLSGGETQRVLFARALAQEPALLILDEPTNHLDVRHQLELLNVASNLGVTVIATLHDINIAARWSDRVCLVDGGRVRALGAADAVLDPVLLGSIYGVVVDRDRDPRTGRPRFTFHLDI
jgi:iron complex transport system ATP-binding protein